MSLRIVADSASDLWKLDDIDFMTIPLTISTDEKTYADDETLDVHEMLDYLASYKGRSYTACPSLGAWLKAFEGADEIFVVTITSALSGTYNSAMTAKDMYLEKHPDVKICVIDSLSTGVEERLILEKIAELKKSGKTFEEVSTEILEYQKTTRLFFAFQSIHNLAENGRVPKLIAKAIGVLGISIVGTASEEGKVEPTGKCRGKKAVLSKMLNMVKEAGFKGERMIIHHVENEELARAFEDMVKSEYPNVNITFDVCRGLCAYYVERGGFIVGIEC